MSILNRLRVMSHLVFQVPPAHVMLVFPRASLVSCLACSENGWRGCNRFRPAVLAVQMLCSACWSSTSAQRDKARHFVFYIDENIFRMPIYPMLMLHQPNANPNTTNP